MLVGPGSRTVAVRGIKGLSPFSLSLSYTYVVLLGGDPKPSTLLHVNLLHNKIFSLDINCLLNEFKPGGLKLRV